MGKLNRRLLVVSHVLVHVYHGRIFVKGAFGRQMDALAQRFDEVRLFTCAKSPGGPLDEYFLRSSNITVVEIPPIWNSNRLVRYINTLMVMIYASLKLLPEIQKASIVHTRLPSPVSGLGTIYAKLMGKPLLVYVAGDRESLLKLKGWFLYPIAFLSQLLLRILVNGTVCFTTGFDLASKIGGPNENIIPVVSAAMDSGHIIDEDTALKRAEQPMRKVLFVGGIGSAKGVDVLLHAVRDLKKQGQTIHLTLIGQTHDSGNWLSRNLDELDLHEVVTYLGYLSWERVLEEYEKNDVLILPSLSEGVPHVIVEAISRGVPVIASRVGGIPWLIQHRKNGFLISPGSSDEIVQALATIISDNELRRELIVGGIELARRSTLSGVVDRMVEKVQHRYG